MNSKGQEKNYNDWYAFHFGSEFVHSQEFNPETLYGKIYKDCYVMMADLCSFTAFFKATPNLRIIESLMSKFYTSLRKVIHRHSGMLDKILGDGVIGVWGLHCQYPNLPQEIIATVISLVQIANEIASEWQSCLDILIEPKGLRIGLCRGEVLVIRRNESYPGLSILGNPINLASRLEQAAAPNHLFCTHSVYEDIRHTLSSMGLPFSFYENHCRYLDAKNYGTIQVDEIDCSRAKVIK